MAVAIDILTLAAARAGKGGGSASKYKQPEWGVEENGVIFPKTTLVVDAEMGAAVIVEPFEKYLAVGEVYTVNYNGADYECTAIEAEGACVLGNAAALGVEGATTDEPFVVMAYPHEQVAEVGLYALVVPLDGSTSFTLSISGKAVHPIPSEYIGSAVYYAVAEQQAENVCTFKVPFDEVEAAVRSGKVVYASVGGNLYPLVGMMGGLVIFAGVSSFTAKDMNESVYFYHSDGTGEWYYIQHSYNG